MWGTKQFKQQARVIDKKYLSYACNSQGFNGMVIREWKRNV